MSAGESKTQVVLFLGAGFSAALGLPTTAQIGDRLLASSDDTLAEIEEFISARIREFWETVFGWRPGVRPPTLEDHFTQIDMAANSGHHLGPVYGPRKLRAVRRMTIHRIFTLLKSRYVQDPRVLEFFKAVNEAFEVTFVTTNWDTETELCLEDWLTIPVNYGDDVVTAAKGQSPPCGIPVLKLHGSINRAHCDCCTTNILFPEMTDAVIGLRLLLNEGDFELFDGGKELADRLRTDMTSPMGQLMDAERKCPVCGVRLNLSLATFSYRKNLNADAFYSIWDKAKNILQSAERWLFIGYSLPEADIEIRHLLKSAQLARRDPSRLSIDVVLKEDCEASERYKRFFGLRDEQIFQQGLEEWIINRLNGYLS